MTADAQGFRYTLEPLRARQAWRVEQALAKLGLAAHRVLQAKRELDVHLARLETQHQVCLLESAASTVNPALHRAALGWLAQSRAELEQTQRELEALSTASSAARQFWQAQQSKLAVLDEHRTSELSEYQRNELSRTAKQADSDWLNRRSHELAAGSSFRVPLKFGAVS